MAQAALSGNINTVGLLELLRIPMTTKRTGTLIVICEDADAVDAEARFQYANGQLVSGVLGELRGEAALRKLLSWHDGEFEFIPDTELEGPVDPRLHPVVLAELKSWYAARAGAAAQGAASSRDGAASVARPPASQSAPRSTPLRPASASGPISALGGPRLSQPGVSRPAPTPAPAPAPAPLGRPSSVVGSGLIDTRGNMRDVAGQLSPRDGALAFAALQLGAGIGKDLGLGNPNGIEIRGKRDRWIAASVRGEVAIVIVCPPDSDLSDELARR
jgi:hypothetical protein